MIATSQTTKKMIPATPPPPSSSSSRAPRPAAPHHAAPRPVRQQRDRADERGDDRHHADVEIADVAHLVRDDALQLLAIERIEQTRA